MKLKSFAVFMLLVFGLSAFADTLDSPRQQTDLKSFRNLSPDRYSELLTKYKNRGYRPIDVEIHAERSRRTYALIMRKNTDNKAWAIHTQLNSDQYSEKWQYYKSRGYRVLDQESYELGTFRKKQYYAGIWVKNTSNWDWSSNRNLSSSQFSSRLRRYRDQRNLMPIDVDAYEANGKTYWAGVWVENKDGLRWSLRRNIQRSDFGDHFKKYSDRGYRLLDTNSYTVNRKQYFATIWVKDTRRGNPKWLARRDMSSKGFHNWWNRFNDLGYRLEDVEHYDTPNGERFAGVWVEDNRNITNWSPKGEVLKVIRDFRKDESPVGVSVAIAHKGKIRFARGFGKHNKKANRDAHSGTIYRMASISKAFSGTLGFLLQNRDYVSLNDDVRDYLPGLPDFHKYTLGDLLTNRSMVRHYFDDSSDEPDALGDDQFNSAWKAVKYFMNDPLESGRYQYSTHGYTIFAAAAEKATGRSFCSLLERYIARPHNLSTLSCENQKAPGFYNPQRAEIYTEDDGDRITRSKSNLSWKYAGGGLESSVKDLAKFGMLLHQNRVLSSSDVQTMTTRPDNGRRYGYGWDHGFEWQNRLNWYGKGGLQAGARSYIRVYPDEDLVIAVMVNQRLDNNNLQGLTRDLAEKSLE